MVRQEFLSGMQARLKEFDEKLERLALRPAPKGEGARLEREKTYYYLKASRAELAERLKQARYTPDASWQEFKDAMQRVFEDMARRLDKS